MTPIIRHDADGNCYFILSVEREIDASVKAMAEEFRRLLHNDGFDLASVERVACPKNLDEAEEILERFFRGS